jgi:hypothetical protein
VTQYLHNAAIGTLITTGLRGGRCPLGTKTLKLLRPGQQREHSLADQAGGGIVTGGDQEEEEGCNLLPP